MEQQIEIRLKMDLMRSLNAIIEGINEVGERYELMNLDFNEGRYVDWSAIPRSLQCTDIKFDVLVGYVKDIAARAIELKDEKLLELLEGLGAIKRTEADEPRRDATPDTGIHAGVRTD